MALVGDISFQNLRKGSSESDHSRYSALWVVDRVQRKCNRAYAMSHTGLA